MGAKTLGIASFYLRAVCQNRNIWGAEDFQEITIRHSKYAASRFAQEAAPALTRFANSSPQGFVNGIKAARQQIVARTDEDRDDFLRKRGFSKAESGKIIEKVLMEEGRPPESIFDFVQGITRLARDKTQQDVRLVPDLRASGENAPSHRVLVGRAEIGAAWTKTSNEGREYLGLKLDDPGLKAPIYANLFDDEGGEGSSLIWSRPNTRRGD